jgi:hypothetical protein
LKISLDGDPEIYPLVRVGGAVQKIEDNLKTLQERFPTGNRLLPGQSFPGDQMIFLGTCTVSIYNVYRLPEIARYFTRLGLLFHTSQVQEPGYQSSQCLPSEAKEKITRKLEAFLENIKKEMDRDFTGQELWKNEDVKRTQLSRVRKFVGNSIAYMNARDRSHLYPRLKEFESAFAKASQTKRFEDIYPELA